MDRLGVAMSGGPGAGAGVGHARSAGTGSGSGVGMGVGEQMSASVPSVLAGLGKRAAVRGLRGMVERAGVGEYFPSFALLWDSLWGLVLTWGVGRCFAGEDVLDFGRGVERGEGEGEALRGG